MTIMLHSNTTNYSRLISPDNHWDVYRVEYDWRKNIFLLSSCSSDRKSFSDSLEQTEFVLTGWTPMLDIFAFAYTPWNEAAKKVTS